MPHYPLEGTFPTGSPKGEMEVSVADMTLRLGGWELSERSYKRKIKPNPYQMLEVIFIVEGMAWCHYRPRPRCQAESFDVVLPLEDIVFDKTYIR